MVRHSVFQILGKLLKKFLLDRRITPLWYPPDRHDLLTPILGILGSRALKPRQLAARVREYVRQPYKFLDYFNTQDAGGECPGFR